MCHAPHHATVGVRYMIDDAEPVKSDETPGLITESPPRCRLGRVDPDRGGQRRRFGALAHEPLGMGRVGGGEHLSAGLVELAAWPQWTTSGVIRAIPE